MLDIAKLFALELDLSVEDAEEVLSIGLADGMTPTEILRLFVPAPVSFADMVKAERQFIADHKWSESKSCWIPRRKRQQAAA
jgi:hypothetical protein